MTRLEEFLAARAGETYPEPPSAGHTDITRQMVECVCKLIPAKGWVLDVGCGQGVAMEMFQQRNQAFVIGTTLNNEDLAELEKKHLDARLCAMEDLPYEWGETFDLVWARHVIEHSTIPFYALCEFHRLLKPTGWLYLEVPAPDTSCFHESNQNHYSVFGDRAWQALIVKARFQLIEMRVWTLQTPAGPDKYFSYVCRKPLSVTPSGSPSA